MDIAEGEVYRMRRQHPCGSWEWRVTRTGADIGIECLVCGRKVQLELPVLQAATDQPGKGSQPGPAGTVAGIAARQIRRYGDGWWLVHQFQRS